MIAQARETQSSDSKICLLLLFTRSASYGIERSKLSYQYIYIYSVTVCIKKKKVIKLRSALVRSIFNLHE